LRKHQARYMLPRMLTRLQILAARAMLEMTRADLAAKVGLSVTGLGNIETGISDPKVSTMEAIQTALEASGVVFIPADTLGPGVRLKKPPKRR
jgi:DNA-binding XRE family transcriptional regulator